MEHINKMDGAEDAPRQFAYAKMEQGGGSFYSNRGGTATTPRTTTGTGSTTTTGGFFGVTVGGPPTGAPTGAPSADVFTRAVEETMVARGLGFDKVNQMMKDMQTMMDDLQAAQGGGGPKKP